MASLQLKQLVKSFGETTVIHGVDLQVDDGEFVVFVGPSGCGKSTLLRLICGLEEATAGELLLDGQRVNEVRAADRGLAMVFQSYALYPHMTVYQNMAFGLENIGTPREAVQAKVDGAAKLLQLDALLQRKPTQLSGGQRQRVAIGRAIVREPKDLPVRRAAVQPRRRVAGVDARRDHRAAPTPGRDDDLRHPRPGRGHDHGRQDRRAARRQDRTGRHAARLVQPAGEPLRRRLHRLAANELRAGGADGRAGRRTRRSVCVPNTCCSRRRPTHSRWRCRSRRWNNSAATRCSTARCPAGATAVTAEVAGQHAAKPDELITLHAPRAACHFFDASGSAHLPGSHEHALAAPKRSSRSA